MYDALVSERIYKKAYSHREAIRMILEGECGVFNPLLLECLVDIQDKIKEELEIKEVTAIPDSSDAHCSAEKITKFMHSVSEDLEIPEDKRMDFHEYETSNQKFLHAISQDIQNECVRPLELSEISEEAGNMKSKNKFHSLSRVEEHKRSRWKK